MKPTHRPSNRRVFLTIILGVLLLCPLSVGISALSNLGLPTASTVIDHLGEADKARLAEVNHLRQTLGGQVWPGFEQIDLPVLLYNEEYAFLAGYSEPPQGWIKVPATAVRGGLWEPVPGDTIDSQTYYRQPVADGAAEIGAFTVKVGERWVPSMTTLEWTKIHLRDYMREDLPGFLRPVFPYRLATAVFDSDVQILGILHESFHAFQGTVAGPRLAAAEKAVQRYGDIYPWDEPQVVTAWETELDAIVTAMNASALDETEAAARRFLEQRAARRVETRLSPDLVDYERQREWLEGMALYTELSVYRLVSQDGAYEPVAEVLADNDFHGYANFERRWADELRRLPKAVDRGDGLFYATGMAQAFLLDRLMPDWKEHVFEEGVWLEDLLAEVLGGQ